jgi:hypothetical protein
MTTEERLAELAKETLETFMSDISEDHYAAGWNMGLEYDLWSMVRGGSRHYGMGTVTEADVAKLKQLADEAGGWWKCDEFVPIAEWRVEYARWFRQNHIPSLQRFAEFLKGRVGTADMIGRVTTEEHVESARREAADAEATLPQVEAEAI